MQICQQPLYSEQLSDTQLNTAALIKKHIR